MIILYSTGCPKCNVLKKKLAQKGLEFELIEDVDKVVAFGESKGITSAPILEVDGEAMDFIAANRFLQQ